MGITLKQLTDTVSQIKDYILNKTHKIDQISYAQKTVNTELDYCYCTQGPTEVSYQNDGSMAGKIKYVTPTSYNTNMEYNTEENYVLLKAGKKYFISATIRFTGTGITNTSQCLVGYNVVNKDTGLVITAQGVDQTVILSHTSGTECIGCATPNEDIKVMLGITWLSGKITAIPSATMVIQEIGHDILIDPVEYVNQHDGIEDSPVGHIISHMGTTAPKHYLICDGTIYNIVDYPYLAQHMVDNFGKVNYFGGDGVDTFAVPDLRGEFLRGSGTAARATGSGAAVGVHQEPTQHARIQNYENKTVAIDVGAPGWSTNNPDKFITINTKTRYYKDVGIQNSTSSNSVITSRPTNTSVLYCIKYEPTYYMQVKNTNYIQPNLYSKEERVVGCWINGKPIYQKIIKSALGTVTDNVQNTVTIDISDLKHDEVISLKGMTNNGSQIPIPSVSGIQFTDGKVTYCNFFTLFINDNDNTIILRHNGATTNNVPVFICIEYTKTTDTENSFTDNMIQDYIIQSSESEPYSEEEVTNAVNEIWQ